MHLKVLGIHRKQPGIEHFFDAGKIALCILREGVITVNQEGREGQGDDAANLLPAGSYRNSLLPGGGMPHYARRLVVHYFDCIMAEGSAERSARIRSYKLRHDILKRVDRNAILDTSDRHGGRKMLNLAQRLIFGCVLLAGLTIGLAVLTHHAMAATGQSSIVIGFSVAAVLLASATIAFVLMPVRSLARDARKIAQGNLEHRVEWSSRDSFGAIAAELNRMAVRLRDLRETEAGRRQMEFQLSDAVLQSIFEPVIVTDGKGHLLKTNPAAAEMLGEAAKDRMALANTPGGDKILSAIRDAIAMQRPVAAEGEASMLPMRIGKQARSFRLRTTPMRDSEGRLLGTVTTLEDVTSLQEVDRFKTQFLGVASRKLRDPLLQLRRGLYALGQGFGGDLTPLQAELVNAASQESQKLDDLMADLIEVAEIDVGKRDFIVESLPPLPMLREARDRYCDQAAEKRISVEINAYADLSHVRADRRALRSILDNLLSNSLR